MRVSHIDPDFQTEPNRRLTIGALSFCAFLLCIPLSNWLINNIGMVCIQNGPCLVPVAPGVMTPSGVLVVGFALVLRDVVQRLLGVIYALAAIIIGAAISAFVAPTNLLVASAAAFLLSELIDCAVYTPLQRRSLMLAIVVSSIFGLIVDSVVFLWLAFASLTYAPGQIIGKLWAIMFALPIVHFVRRVVPS